MYTNGKGVSKNYTEALKWYRKSAAQGNIYALASLGWLYENGHGVQKNEAEAMKWYKKAVAGGNEKTKQYLAAKEAAKNRPASRQQEELDWRAKQAFMEMLFAPPEKY
jgi:TPR repeat protein